MNRALHVITRLRERRPARYVVFVVALSGMALAEGSRESQLLDWVELIAFLLTLITAPFEAVYAAIKGSTALYALVALLGLGLAVLGLFFIDEGFLAHLASSIGLLILLPIIYDIQRDGG